MMSLSIYRRILALQSCKNDKWESDTEPEKGQRTWARTRSFWYGPPPAETAPLR
jgi:hypothetical protein